MIVEQFGENEKPVAPEAKVKEDLGANSLDLVELLMACEVAFRWRSPSKHPAMTTGEKLSQMLCIPSR